MKQKYFENKRAANRARDERTKRGEYGLNVWRMPKGTRHAGKYAVCTELEFLNTY